MDSFPRLCTGLWRAVLVLSLAGCASAPPLAPATDLLQDALFAAPSTGIRASDVMAPSEAMKQFVEQVRKSPLKGRDLRYVLIDALYKPDQLALQYDSSATRNAAQAFEARAGNCLSLVLMTGSLAKALGLPVTYQMVMGEASFSRLGDTLFASGHVNLMLGRSPSTAQHMMRDAEREMTIDFLPQQELAGQRVAGISETTVLAMFMNNRAAEALGAGLTDQSYWWARAAVLQDPGFVPSINTLAVVYMRMDRPDLAERALRRALAADPRQTSALSNLVRLLERDGRVAEARMVAQRLASLQPKTPFQALDQGRLALAAGDAAQARRLFTEELSRQPYQHEVHFWLAQVNHQLGDDTSAAHHLALAAQYATTRSGQDLYAAKLASLRSALRGKNLP